MINKRTEGGSQPDDQPLGSSEAHAEIADYSEITAAEIHGPWGIGGSYRGPDSLRYVARLGLPPLFCFAGLGGAVLILTSDRSWLLAVVFLLAAVALAAVFWHLLRPGTAK